MAAVVRSIQKWFRGALPLRRPPAVRNAAQLLGATHAYVNKRDDSAQNKSIGDFREYIRRLLGKSSSVLEIGPGYNPMLAKRDGYNVATLDHDDQEALIKKFMPLTSEASNTEPVDFVWRDGKFADLLAGRKFDAVISSHVVEHAPDFVQFLNDSASALVPEGTIFLIVPDKRYCFDFFQPVSDPAKVLSDHMQNRTRHSFESFYRHFSAGTEGRIVARAVLQDKPKGKDLELEIGDPRGAFARGREKFAKPGYADAHENYFTPASFALLIEELHYLGEIGLRIEILTRARGNEFLIALKRSKAGGVTAPVFAQKKKMLYDVMMGEEYERIQHGVRCLKVLRL